VRRLIVPLALAALAGCANGSTIGGDSALTGQDLQAAVGLYGPWDTQVELDGVPTYIWRRHYTDPETRTERFCELKVEMGFRRLISRSQMQGYPAACELFSIRYQSTLK
jgi:hypothetical protein